MLRATLPTFVVLFLAGASVSLAANISLIIPGFDPQPLSADIGGVGADGETTYILYPGQPTGTWVSQPPAFSGTATVIEDADNVVFEFANSALSITVMESCTVAGGTADCLVGLGGLTSATAVEAVTPLLVQGGSTLSGVPTSSGASTQTTAAPGSSGTASAATQTGSSASASPTQSSSSGGVRLAPAIAAVAVVVAISAVLV